MVVQIGTPKNIETSKENPTPKAEEVNTSSADKVEETTEKKPTRKRK